MAGVSRASNSTSVYYVSGTQTAYPSYDSAGSYRYVPEIFSKKMLRNFYETTAFNLIANTDYEGEIKKQGDSVVIRTIPEINITAYTVGQELEYQVPSSADVVLAIDQAFSWAYQLDDIDEVATDLPLMQKFTADAGERLKVRIDTECFEDLVDTAAATTNRGDAAGALSGDIDLGVTGTPLSITKTNASEIIVDYNTVLDEGNIPSEGRWVCLPAWNVGMLKKSDIKSADITGDSTGVIRSGVVGMVDRTMVIQTNTLYSDSGEFWVMAGTKEAITFAAQLTKSEELRIPNSFGTYVRGLAVYGMKTVQPTALVQSVVSRG